MGFRDIGVPGAGFRVLNLRAYDLKVWGCLGFRVSRFGISLWRWSVGPGCASLSCGPNCTVPQDDDSSGLR